MGTSVFHENVMMSGIDWNPNTVEYKGAETIIEMKMKNLYLRDLKTQIKAERSSRSKYRDICYNQEQFMKKKMVL